MGDLEKIGEDGRCITGVWKRRGGAFVRRELQMGWTEHLHYISAGILFAYDSRMKK